MREVENTREALRNGKAASIEQTLGEILRWGTEAANNGIQNACTKILKDEKHRTGKGEEATLIQKRKARKTRKT